MTNISIWFIDVTWSFVMLQFICLLKYLIITDDKLGNKIVTIKLFVINFF